jgi:hypothetical protein
MSSGATLAMSGEEASEASRASFAESNSKTQQSSDPTPSSGAEDALPRASKSVVTQVLATADLNLNIRSCSDEQIVTEIDSLDVYRRLLENELKRRGSHTTAEALLEEESRATSDVTKAVEAEPAKGASITPDSCEVAKSTTNGSTTSAEKTAAASDQKSTSNPFTRCPVNADGSWALPAAAPDNLKFVYTPDYFGSFTGPSIPGADSFSPNYAAPFDAEFARLAALRDPDMDESEREHQRTWALADEVTRLFFPPTNADGKYVLPAEVE